MYSMHVLICIEALDTMYLTFDTFQIRYGKQDDLLERVIFGEFTFRKLIAGNFYFGNFATCH